MLSKKQDVVCARAWLGLVGSVVLWAGCPGYLEEQAFRIADGGIAVAIPEAGPVLPPPAPAGAGGSYAPPAAPPTGTGGSPGAAATPAAPPPVDAAQIQDAPAASGGPAAPMVRACATGPEIVAKILMPKCAKCHKADAPAGGLDLATMGAKARLLNVASSKCAGKTLAVDTPAAGGHFFDKLAGPVQGCGMRMPLGGVALSAEEIDCLKEWIKPPGPVIPAPAAAPVSCSAPAEITSKILVPKCGMCHGAAAPAGGLDLVTAGSKARLVGIASKACPDRIFITAEGDVTGHFFEKLVGPVPGCGNQMPYGGNAPLNAAEIKCLKDWIRPTP